MEARKALPFPEVAAPSKKAKLEVTSLKDFATAKASFQDFLDFNKYLQQASACVRRQAQLMEEEPLENLSQSSIDKDCAILLCSERKKWKK